MGKFVFWLIPMSIVWYVANFHSDWIYPIIGVNMDDDPDKIIAMFVLAIGIVVIFLIVSAIFWLIYRALKHVNLK